MNSNLDHINRVKLSDFVKSEGLCASLDPVSGTSKEYEHSYLSQIYQFIFEHLGYSIDSLLEIGVAKGASLEMWRKLNLIHHITAIEPNANSKSYNSTKNWRNIDIIWDDAYRRRVYGQLKKRFTLIIDDGPHTYWSQKISLRKYPKILANQGFYILEDIENIEKVIDKYFISIPRKLRHCVHLFDLRKHALNKEMSVAIVIHACDKRYLNCEFKSMKHSGVVISKHRRNNLRNALVVRLENITDFILRIVLNGIRHKFRIRN